MTFLVERNKATMILNSVFPTALALRQLLSDVRYGHLASVFEQRALRLKGRIGETNDKTPARIDQMPKCKVQTSQIEIVSMILRPR